MRARNANSHDFLIKLMLEIDLYSSLTVEQAHKIHMLAKDLQNCSKEIPCVLPDTFVAEGIISNFPPSWRDFATSLKDKRQQFTNDGFIGTLDVEEKARAKDTCRKGIVGA